MSDAPEVSVVLPCLNEAETLGTCIQKAQRCFAAHGLRGEVVVADNGSTDGSREIAEQLGARVVPAHPRGYGAAVMAGLEAARGDFVVIADSDDSYDLGEVHKFIAALRGGAEFAMGTRYRRAGGRVEPGAMPFLHYWLGTPVLSALARVLFGARITDINSGMRGLRRDAVGRLNLRMTGMEVASEIVIKAALLGLRTVEVPITLHRDGRSRRPHLRTWRDGWRHLRMMLLFSPRWLFGAPGLLLTVLGGLGLLLLAGGPKRLGGIGFDINTMLVSSLVLAAGAQLLLLGVMARAFVAQENLLPRQGARREPPLIEWWLLAGLGFLLVGAYLVGTAVLGWAQGGFGQLAGASRRVVFGAVLLAVGVQLGSAGFFLGLLGLSRTRSPPDHEGA